MQSNAAQHWMFIGMCCLLFPVGLYLRSREVTGFWTLWYKIVGWVFVIFVPVMVVLFLAGIIFHA